MLVTSLLFVLVPLGITMLVTSRRVAAVTSLAGAAVVWVWIARTAYHSPIPANEPEWWGGLALVCSLAAIGAAAGALLRHRQSRSAAS